MKITWIKFRRREHNRLYDPKFAKAMKELKQALANEVYPYLDKICKNINRIFNSKSHRGD